jgi:hypothetical protein
MPPDGLLLENRKRRFAPQLKRRLVRACPRHHHPHVRARFRPHHVGCGWSQPNGRPPKAVIMPNFCRVFRQSKFPASREFSREFHKNRGDRICHAIASFGAATMGVAAQGHQFARPNK